MIRWLALVAVVLATACDGSGSPSPDASTTGTFDSFTIKSQNTGIAYPISIYLPPGSSQSGPLPAIYALDAETRFADLAAVMQAKGVRAILVGVANTGSDRRQVDFLMPGAVPYYHFLVDELAPAIESRYGADPARRMLSGLSSAGLFVGYAFFMETPANHRFSAFLSADGSFWQQPDEVETAEANMYAANVGRDLPLTLLLGGDTGGNYVYVDALYRILVSRNYPGLQLDERVYTDGHVAMDVPFFTDCIAVLFPAGS